VTSKDEGKRGVGVGHLFPRKFCEGNIEGGAFTGDPEGYAK